MSPGASRISLRRCQWRREVQQSLKEWKTVEQRREESARPGEVDHVGARNGKEAARRWASSKGRAGMGRAGLKQLD